MLFCLATSLALRLAFSFLFSNWISSKMGSVDQALLTGFICRLCSEMHRVVMHIYGEEGMRLCITEKINRYLSINVSRSDPLPKTICKNCLERLENQHKLVMRIEQHANMLKNQQRSRVAKGSCVGLCNNANEPPNPSSSDSSAPK